MHALADPEVPPSIAFASWKTASGKGELYSILWCLKYLLFPPLAILAFSMFSTCLHGAFPGGTPEIPQRFSTFFSYDAPTSMHLALSLLDSKKWVLWLCF